MVDLLLLVDLFYVAYVPYCAHHNAKCHRMLHAKLSSMRKSRAVRVGGGEREAGAKGPDVTVHVTVEPEIYIFFAYKHVSHSAGYMQD